MTVKFHKDVKVEYARIVLYEDQSYIMFSGKQKVKTATGPIEISIYYKMKISLTNDVKSWRDIGHKPVVFNCHWSHFDNLKCFLDAEGNNRVFGLNYYDDNKSDLTKEHNIGYETLIINGKCHNLNLSGNYAYGSTVRAITSPYITNPAPKYNDCEAVEI